MIYYYFLARRWKESDNEHRGLAASSVTGEAEVAVSPFFR